MRLWRWGATILLAAWVAGCGGNSTPVTVTISPSTPQSVLEGGTDQFAGVASGNPTTTVFWQVCLPPATSTNQPTNCTQGVGPTQCSIPTISNPLTGFGTISPNGLYAAPNNIPTPNNFLVVATSCAVQTAFMSVSISIDSGIRVQINPTTPVTIGTGENFLFTVTVSGTLNKAVTWSVDGMVGGNATDGFICPIPNPPNPNPCQPNMNTTLAVGTYIAPGIAPGSAVTITAQSAADPSKQGSTSVTVSASGTPTLSTIDPTVAAQGSVQQDVYLINNGTGTGFFSTSTAVASVCPAVPATPVPTTFINTTLLRATIPSSLLQQSGSVCIAVMSQNDGASGGLPLVLQTVRPAVVFSTPDSVPTVNANFGVILTGGFFSPGGNLTGSTNVTFNGTALNSTVVDSRHLSFTVQGGVATPGLYPITVQNNGNPQFSGVNLAVQPAPGDIATGQGASIAVKTKPSAIAIDPALGIAVVTNNASNSVSVVNLTTQATTTIGVGQGPMGVAIDDQLPDHLALVVNNTDQTVSVVDLSLQAVVGQALPVSIGPMATSPLPFSIGINPQTHRGIVTYQSTNQALIIDLVNANPAFTPACSTAPCPVSLIGGSVGSGPASYGTGQSPAVAIDQRLNWAVVTPGGAGNINIVDLGRPAVPANGLNPSVAARAPSLVGTVQLTASIQGIGINTETHQLLLTDPSGTNLTAFSLLDNTIAPLTFTLAGVPINKPNYVAAGVNPLTNTGIAINTDGTAVVVDLAGGKVLQTVTLGNSPQAVAIDAANNRAVVVNQGDNAVSIVSLGTNFRSLQIAEISPPITFVSNPAADLPLTINGGGFVPGLAQVFLDGTPLAGIVSNGGRTVTTTVPGAMLGSARLYHVTVRNQGSTDTSNIAELTVIQPVTVGAGPFGVAVDTDRDTAVVTNSVDGTISLVNLTTGTVLNPASPIRAGATPEGVAVIPRLGLAVVANFASNSLTVLDDTGATNDAITAANCGTTCMGPTGVAIDQDQNRAAIAGSLSNTVSIVGSLSATGMTADSDLNSPNVDPNPTAVAIDPNPNFNYVGVATSSQFSSLDLVKEATGAIADRINGLQVPSGVIFDPVNQVFLVANSLFNQGVIVDPVTFIQTPVQVGINPTSLDYNFQASTLVTFNSASNTLSVLDYVCPPTPNNAANCEGPRAHEIIGLGGSPQFSLAIDPKLNLAVLTDILNNRVLLIPLPH